MGGGIHAHTSSSPLKQNTDKREQYPLAANLQGRYGRKATSGAP
jgi:hypothetical protein